MNISGKGAAYLALVTAMLLWGSSFIALKLAFRHYDPMVVIFGRMIIASICFMPFLSRFRSTIDYRPGDIRLILFMAICEPGLYFVFETLALQHTDAAQAGMICAMLPLMVALAAGFFLKERITRKTILGFTMAVAGAVGLSLWADVTETASNPLLGNTFEFLAMVTATGYMIALKKLVPRYNSWFLTMIQAVVGTVFFFPLLFLPSTELPTQFSAEGAMYIAYLGIAVTIGAYGFYNMGLSRVSATRSSAFVNLIPVITLVLGVLVLGERMNLVQYAASALVLAGVMVSQDKEDKVPQ